MLKKFSNIFHLFFSDVLMRSHKEDLEEITAILEVLIYYNQVFIESAFEN